MIKSAPILAASLAALAVAATVAVFVPLPAAAQSAKNLKCKGCVNSRDVKNNGIKSKDIKDGQVRTPDLADDAVTGDKIAEGAVGASKLGANVVTSTATPISSCTTISESGSYVLTQNIALAPGTTEECIAIAADFVTLDLAGHMIGGTGDGEGIADLNVSRQSISIHNGTVTQFDTGVNLSNTVGGHLHGLHVLNNGGRGIDAGSGFIVSNNVVIGNGGQGIFVGFTNSSTTVSGNIANDNNFGGIILSGTGMTVIGNTANDNSGVGRNGISVTCPSNVLNNTAVNNAGDNLFLSGATCNDANNVAP